MKDMIILVMVFSIVFSFNGLVFASDNSFGKPSPADVLGDILVIRPLGAIEIAFNSFFFVVSLPVTVPLKKKNEAEQILIGDPYNFYFNRRLGEPLGKM